MTEVVKQVPETVNIAMRRGDSLGLSIQVWDDDAHTAPSDLSGTLVSAQSRQDPDGPLLGDWQVSLDGNSIALTLPAKVAQELPLLSYWDCQVDWHSDGLAITTIAAGAVAANRDVTHD